MIYERDKPRLALEDGFPKFVTPFTGDSESFIGNVLEPFGDAAVLLTQNDTILKQFGLAAAAAMRALERVDNKDWMAPALLRLWKRKANDAAEIGAFFVRLERLTYFLFVCRYGINDRIARFASVMDEIDPRAGRTKTGLALDLTGIEQTEFLQTLDGPMYTKSRICKPVLQRLDESLSSGGATYHDIISIEHVLPQTVDDNSEWAHAFSDTERAYWTHRMVNLVFLTKRINTRASNWDFARKRLEYFASKDGTSPFPITQAVLQTDAWSISHLENRQAQLIAKLAELWSLKESNTPSPALALDNEGSESSLSGKELNKRWGIGAQHVLYRKDGKWYHRLERFPGALCDENGYILFKTESDLQACPGIKIGREKNQMHVATGIATLPGYQKVTSY
jgi:hypothetical protein